MKKALLFSLPLAFAGLTSMQALGQNKEALAQLDKIASLQSNSTEIAFIRSDILIQQHHWTEASAIPGRMHADQPGPSCAHTGRPEFMSCVISGEGRESNVRRSWLRHGFVCFVDYPRRWL